MAEATIEASVFLAAKGGYVDDLTELSNAPHNASFAVQDSLGNTPLHYAAGGTHAAAVEFLASTGPDTWADFASLRAEKLALQRAEAETYRYALQATLRKEEELRRSPTPLAGVLPLWASR